MITNLISNAIRYAPGAPIEFLVSAEGNYALLQIQDYGAGIAVEDWGRIFGRYECTVSGQSSSGLGLGLYICRQFVEAHGGTIDVTSPPGKGAMFSVRLPMSEI